LTTFPIKKYKASNKIKFAIPFAPNFLNSYRATKNGLKSLKQENEGMKTKIILLACILMTVLTFGTANAAIVTVHDGNPTIGMAIDELAFNGHQYSVDFSYFEGTYSGPVYDASFASAAAAAIATELNGAGVVWVGDNDVLDHLDNTFFIASGNDSGVYAYGTNTLTYDKPYGVDWESFISGNQSFSNMYATVTETAPIPGAALLFGSALVLIGAIRRRFNQ
jgi:hypothetical protein